MKVGDVQYALTRQENLQSLINSADDKIINRGEEYYASEQIETLTLSPDGHFIAEVWGSQGELYNVTVNVDKDGNVADFSCNCPYDWDDIYKHLVAVFMAIQKGEYEKSKAKPKAQTATDISTVIGAADTEKLRRFVMDYADKDDRFKNEFLHAFGKPDTDAELSQIKEQVRNILRHNTHRGYIDYSGCNAACTELDSVLSLAEKRVSQGQGVFGFYIALHILLTSAKLASTADSSSGALTETINYSLEVIDTACEAALTIGNADEHKKLYEKCVKESQNKVFDGWGEWNYSLLRSGTRFVTQKNVGKLYAALDYLAGVYSKWSSYYHIDDKLTRLEIVKRLDGKEAAEKFIFENMELDEFRNMAVDKALEQSDFAYAEQLCTERLNREPNEYGVRVNQKDWLARLFGVYEKSGNLGGQIKIADELLLRGDLSYYEKLKALYTQNGSWEEEYPALRQRCANALPYNIYMEILKRENELRLLLEEVKRHPTSSVFTYGKLLAKEYPADVYSIMKSEIEKQAKEATDRKKYAKVCGSIKTMFEAGGKDTVAELIANFRQTYNRRPAMLDELMALERRLAKIKQP